MQRAHLCTRLQSYISPSSLSKFMWKKYYDSNLFIHHLATLWCLPKERLLKTLVLNSNNKKEIIFIIAFQAYCTSSSKWDISDTMRLGKILVIFSDFLETFLRPFIRVIKANHFSKTFCRTYSCHLSNKWWKTKSMHPSMN